MKIHPSSLFMPCKSKAQCARYQNIKFAHKSFTIWKLEEPNIDVSDIKMTEEPVCGSEDPGMWDDEFENYREGILGPMCWLVLIMCLCSKFNS